MNDSSHDSRLGHTPRIKNRKTFAVLLPLGILTVAISITVLLLAFKKDPQQEEKAIPEVIVNVEQVRKQSIRHTIAAQGMVAPRTETDLISEVNGRIIELAPAFAAGALVKRNDLLLRVESFDYEVELKTAEANLARAQANLQEEIARSQQAEREWRSVGSGQASDLVLRKPQLAREQANVKSTEAELARARRNLQRTVIRAPYDGLMRERLVDLGEFISRGTQLGKIAAVDQAEIRLAVLDKQLAYLSKVHRFNDKATQKNKPGVQLSASLEGQARTWEGFISRSEGVIDPDTRMVYLVAQINDPYNFYQDSHPFPLKFGAFVEAQINGDHAENIVVIPRYSLRGKNQVIVIDDENRIHLRSVTVARSDAESVYISDGLQEGELLCLTPIENPIDGMLVKIENPLNGKDGKAVALEEQAAHVQN